MSEWMMTPQFQDDMYYAFNIPDARAEFVDQLYEQIMQRAAEKMAKPKARLIFGLRPAYAISLAVLTLMIVTTLLIGPQKVYAAFLRLFDYIPGVGIVEQSSEIRVLAEPVSVTRDGITITVSQAVLTSAETKLDYGVAGVPLSAYPRGELVMGCMDQPYLRLEDGRQINLAAEEPVPGDVTEATFMLPCIFDTLKGTVPINWEISIRFIPAPEDFTVLPIMDVTTAPTPTQSIQPSLVVPSLEGPTEEAAATMQVEKVIETEDGYILIGKIIPQLQDDWTQTVGAIILHDADGKKVSSTFANNINDFELLDKQPGESTFSFAFDGSGVRFPIRIEVPGLLIRRAEDADPVEIIFDAGEKPHAGQEWILDQSFVMAGHTIVLQSISAGSQSGYQFRFKGDEGVYGLGVEVEGNPGMGGGGSGLGPEGDFSRSITYDVLPSGKLKLIISHLSIASDEQLWFTEWQPETLRDFPLDEEKASVCWNASTYADIPAAPADLEGWALLSKQYPEPRLLASTFNSSQTEVLAQGGSRAAISQDGSLIAYSTNEGVTILNRLTGESILSQDNHGYDFHWSADGSRFAFVNPGEDFGIFVVDNDDSQRRQLTNLGYESIAGWSTDGLTLYYTVPFVSNEGCQLNALDIQSGISTPMFILENSSLKAPIPAISPDGQWIVYRGGNMNNVYIKGMDGSPAKLLLDQPGIGLRGIVWEEKGEFLGIGVATEENQEGELLILNPQTCQAYRLPALIGEVNGLVLP